MNRVEKLIRKSFLELLKTKSFYDIHVKDILDKEQISRTSFYKYYRDKYDLLDKIQKDLLDEFDGFISGIREKNPEALFINGVPAESSIFTPIFEFANENFDTLNSLFGANGDGLFFEKVIDHITHAPYFLLDNEVLSENFTTDEWDFINSFLAYGYMGLIMNWIKMGKNRRSAEEMGDIMSGIVQGFFGNIAFFTLAQLKDTEFPFDMTSFDVSKLDMSMLDLSKFSLRGTEPKQTEDQ